MNKFLISGVCLIALAACDAPDNAVVVRQCGDYAVEMNFSANGDELRATINGDELVLANVVSASGAKYDGVLNDTAVTLWQQGQDWIMILDDNTVIQCNVK